MRRMFKGLVVTSLMSVLWSIDAFAKLPDEVMVPYRAYAAALKDKDDEAMKANALKAWEAAEEHLGDHKTTGDLAFNYGNIEPTGSEKNRFKNYEKRAKALRRAIELSKLHKEDAGTMEVERRIKLADLELTVSRSRGSLRSHSSQTIGRIGVISDTEDAIEKYGLQGSTFDGDLQVLLARYHQLNDNPEKAIAYGEKALTTYENATDGLFSQYAYFIRLFKGQSHNDLAAKNDDINERVKAALEYQSVMQNLEGELPADHVFVKTAFRKWMKTRSDIEAAGALEMAENAGLCECWPYENYKDKAVPLKRVPPKAPSSARASGHVYVKFDVNDDGEPENISIVSASNSVFEKPALKSVEKWEYSKRGPDVDIENRKNITTKITFKMLDRSGNLVPER